jgi:hypothetical protein
MICLNIAWFPNSVLSYDLNNPAKSMLFIEDDNSGGRQGNEIYKAPSF